MDILVKPLLLVVKFWFQWKAIICQRPSSIKGCFPLKFFFISSPFNLFSWILFYLLFFLLHPVSEEMKSATWVDTSSNFSQLFTDLVEARHTFFWLNYFYFVLFFSSFYFCYNTFLYHTFLFLLFILPYFTWF